MFYSYAYPLSTAWVQQPGAVFHHNPVVVPARPVVATGPVVQPVRVQDERTQDGCCHARTVEGCPIPTERLWADGSTRYGFIFLCPSSSFSAI